MEPNARLLALLDPIAKKVAELDPASRESDAAVEALLAALRDTFPADGESVRALQAEIQRGIVEGWLCDRGDPQARFSRLAKAGEATHGLSVDIVSLEGVGMRHTHPRGEVTIAFASSPSDGSARFDGHEAGWVFMRPGSTHAPTVTGGRMDLLYFLPDGAVQWHPE